MTCRWGERCRDRQYRHDNDDDDDLGDRGKRSKNNGTRQQSTGQSQATHGEELRDGGAVQVERPAERSDARGQYHQNRDDGGRPAERPGEHHHHQSCQPEPDELDEKTMRFAKQIISLTTGKTLQEVREVLCQNITTYGDLQIATQRTCHMLMEGPAQLRPQQLQRPGTEGRAEFTADELNQTATVPTVRELARGRDSPLVPTELFQQRLQAEMQGVGRNLYGLFAEKRAAELKMT
jgi:hypothetical protein